MIKAWRSRNTRLIALLKVTLAVIFWGASFVATKVALQEVSPATIVWLRFAMGVIILGLAVLLRRQFTSRINLTWLILPC